MAADVSNGGNTFEPDLVSVQFIQGATTGTAAQQADSAIFTFDQEVDTANPVAANFFVYTDDGTTFTGQTAVVNEQNQTQVLVTFDDPNATTASTTAVDRAVGGSVEDGAVTTEATATTVALTNEQDEVGQANTTATDGGQTAGRTDNPDLTGVSLAQGTNQFGSQTGFQATYTFDEAVDTTPTAGGFFLYLADGTRLFGTNCTTGTTTSGSGQNNNTVTCSAFDVAGGTTDATSAQIGSAVLGTVDSGAVTALDNTTQNAGSNPEGAEFTSGGTGTRTA